MNPISKCFAFVVLLNFADCETVTIWDPQLRTIFDDLLDSLVASEKSTSTTTEPITSNLESPSTDEMEWYLRANYELPYNPRSLSDCFNYSLVEYMDIQRFDTTGKKRGCCTAPITLFSSCLSVGLFSLPPPQLKYFSPPRDENILHHCVSVNSCGSSSSSSFFVWPLIFLERFPQKIAIVF